jgi:hypothetical protein
LVNFLILRLLNYDKSPDNVGSAKRITLINGIACKLAFKKWTNTPAKNGSTRKNCVAYLSIIVQSLIEKYAFILFLRIFMCFEGHKYGCCDLDLWDMHMKH